MHERCYKRFIAAFFTFFSQMPAYRSLIILIPFFSLNFFNAGSTSAQPLIETIPSIDSLVINSDYVYVARITKVRDEPIPGGSKLPGFTFEVEETLKCPMNENPTSEIKRRAMFVEPPTTRYKDWMNRQSRLLIISNDASSLTPTVIELTPNKPTEFSSDLRLLRTAEQIIQAARDAIKRTPTNVERLHTHHLEVPRDVYKDTRWESSDGIRLEVPADAKLEQWAIETLPSEDPWYRLQAAQAMRYFKSEQNAERLKVLLNDSAVSNSVDDSGKSITYYFIRDEAYQTLKRWGVKIKQPVLRREITPR